MNLSLLLLEDNSLDADLILSRLAKAGYEVATVRAENRSQFDQAIRREKFDLILSDFSLPDFDGLRALDLAKVFAPDTPFIIVSGVLGEEFAIEALHRGASDYVLKTRLEKLAEAVERSLQQSRLISERRVAQENERTARAEAEAKATELQRSLEDLEHFAFVASHDLREPLRVITSYGQLLQRNYGEDLDDRGREWLQQIERSSRRLTSLVHDLLSYSRVVHAEEAFADFDSEGALSEALESCRVAIDEAGGAVRYGKLPRIHGNRRQISQVFQNLVQNAVKYRAEAPPEIDISVLRQNGFWQFCVRDNGIGIDPKYAERIFVIFRRLHGSEVEGSGVGLALCKRVVERHGGKIWLKSEPLRGSSFFFTLPAATGKIEARAAD